jgi:hypothetical protein
MLYYSATHKIHVIQADNISILELQMGHISGHDDIQSKKKQSHIPFT